MTSLKGKVAVVAGATRGAGRGIACALGEAGAIVYCTGRSTRGTRSQGSSATDSPWDLSKRPETIEETAEMVTARGGIGVPVQVDHTIEDQVKTLFDLVKRDQGRLDILVNDIWGGDELFTWGKSFWELSLEKARLMLERAVLSHIITSRYAAPLMIEAGQGLIVEITDGDSFAYRGDLFYDLVKTAVIRLAFAIDRELHEHNITSLALTPGFLRSEAMLDYFGVTELNWREGAKKDANFIASETPFFVGRAVAALAGDPQVSRKSGRVFSSWSLAEEYDFTDADGRQPNWGKHFEQTYGKRTKAIDGTFYEYWFEEP